MNNETKVASLFLTLVGVFSSYIYIVYKMYCAAAAGNTPFTIFWAALILLLSKVEFKK